MKRHTEIILFCGNPGSGKSSLCNCIFETIVFESGTSLGTGLTNKQQEHEMNDKLYVDTPGLADSLKKKEAAIEIEESLKKHNNYKIIFVVCFISGRVNNQDLVTIDCVCEAIKTDFEYGIVINKVPKRVREKLAQDSSTILACINTLKKKPVGWLMIEEIDYMREEDNVLLTDPANRDRLINFIDKLTANNIPNYNVEKINTENFNAKISDIEEKYTNEIAVLKETMEKEKQELESQWKEDKRRIDELNSKMSDLEIQQGLEKHLLKQDQSLYIPKGWTDIDKTLGPLAANNHQFVTPLTPVQFRATSFVPEAFVPKRLETLTYEPATIKTWNENWGGWVSKSTVEAIDSRGNVFRDEGFFLGTAKKGVENQIFAAEKKHAAKISAENKARTKAHQRSEADRINELGKKNKINQDEHHKQQNQERSNHNHDQRIAQLKDSARQGALVGLISGATVSTIDNVISYKEGQITGYEAGRNIVVSSAMASGTGTVASVVATGFNLITQTSYGNVALTASFFAWDVSQTIHKWFKGEITAAVCAGEIFKKAIVTASGIAGSIGAGALGAYAVTFVATAGTASFVVPIVFASVGYYAFSNGASSVIRDFETKFLPQSPAFALAEAYKLLGVKDTAPNDLVNKNFKSLALIYHPDRNPDNQETMVKLNMSMELIRAARGL